MGITRRVAPGASISDVRAGERRLDRADLIDLGDDTVNAIVRASLRRGMLRLADGTTILTSASDHDRKVIVAPPEVPAPVTPAAARPAEEAPAARKKVEATDESVPAVPRPVRVLWVGLHLEDSDCNPAGYLLAPLETFEHCTFSQAAGDPETAWQYVPHTMTAADVAWPGFTLPAWIKPDKRLPIVQCQIAVTGGAVIAPGGKLPGVLCQTDLYTKATGRIRQFSAVQGMGQQLALRMDRFVTWAAGSPLNIGNRAPTMAELNGLHNAGSFNYGFYGNYDHTQYEQFTDIFAHNLGHFAVDWSEAGTSRLVRGINPYIPEHVKGLATSTNTAQIVFWGWDEINNSTRPNLFPDGSYARAYSETEFAGVWPSPEVSYSHWGSEAEHGFLYFREDITRLHCKWDREYRDAFPDNDQWVWYCVDDSPTFRRVNIFAPSSQAGYGHYFRGWKCPIITAPRPIGPPYTSQYANTHEWWAPVLGQYLLDYAQGTTVFGVMPIPQWDDVGTMVAVVRFCGEDYEICERPWSGMTIWSPRTGAAAGDENNWIDTVVMQSPRTAMLPGVSTYLRLLDANGSPYDALCVSVRELNDNLRHTHAPIAENAPADYNTHQLSGGYTLFDQGGGAGGRPNHVNLGKMTFAVVTAGGVRKVEVGPETAVPATSNGLYFNGLFTIMQKYDS